MIGIYTFRKFDADETIEFSTEPGFAIVVSFRGFI